MTIQGKPLPPDAKMVFKGIIFEVWQWQQTMFDGSVETFEILKRSDSAAVIATVGDKIIAQREVQPYSDEYVTIPGGVVDPGEDPLTAAKRELFEETGYESNEWYGLFRDDPMGKILWTRHVFIARNALKKSEPPRDKGERISPFLISFEEFVTLPDNPSFRASEITNLILRARIDPAKKEALRATIFGT
jgi:8-oxo-dGTP pyrophosphatase MutT (NUDIX family)